MHDVRRQLVVFDRQDGRVRRWQKPCCHPV